MMSCMAPVFVSQVNGQSRNLGDYLREARANSPLLKNYSNELDSNNIERLLIKASNRPQVLANGQVAVYPVIHGYGYDKAITNGGNYSAVVSASQPLFNGGRLLPQYQRIAIQGKILAHGHQIDMLDLEKSIVSQYLTAFGDWQAWQSNKEVYRILQSQQDILKRLTAQGIYKQSDYLNYLTGFQSQEVAMDQLELQYKNDLSLLNYLSGIDDTTEVALAYPDIALRRAAPADSSVFLQSYQLDSLQIANEKALLRTRYKPSLSWFADAGWQTSMLKRSYQDFGTSLGLDFSVPIYDGRQKALKDHQLAIAEKNRQNTSDFYHKQLAQQVAMLNQQLNGINGLIAKIDDRIKTSRLLVDVNRRLLNTGDVRITDYIGALNNYLTLKSTLNQQKINRYQVINQLNYWQR